QQICCFFSFLFGIFENPQYEKTKGKIAAAVGKIPYLSVEGIKEKNTAIVRLFRLAWCCRE
ncbi:hypothetical protein, partial [Phascolarctobacterium faecium]|uniref:hypothetical protein n=1 Tax=Phascolarctobacterium faecium TaxID=33025 RepID=UPI00242A3827